MTATVPKPKKKLDLLLVDDDQLIVESIALILQPQYSVTTAATRPEALNAVRRSSGPDLALIDLGLPPEPHEPDEGFRLIASLLSAHPEVKILVLSGQNERRNIQHALTLGAVDFIPKPCDADLLRARLQHHAMILDAERVTRLQQPTPDRRLIGNSGAMDELRANIERYANTPFPVLIEGESGTGKELVAAGIHDGGEHATYPFLSVNCAAFTADLLESQLFGHAKGAFTGAAAAKPGFFEEANGGTLFLDEIGEFPIELQPKLLRVLENGEFYRIGETRPRLSDARIVAATNQDLQALIREGRFRQDLYHRLSVLTIHVPPLREREGDADLLLEHFQTVYATRVAPFSFTNAAHRRWVSYGFPGNVRELRNIVIRLGAKYPGGDVALTDLEKELDTAAESDFQAIRTLTEGNFRLDDILGAWERRYIEAALELSNGNLSEAARLLGVNRTTLYSKVQRLRAISQ